MAGNQHEGLGDDFFEQILAVPPPYGSTGGDVGSMPPMGLQLSSTSADDRTAAAAAAAENNHMMMRVSMGMGMMPSPLALNLEQVGFFRHEDTNNNGREQVHMPSLFPPFGNLQSQQQLLRPQPPSVPTQLQQSFHNQATAGGVAPAPQPPAGRPRVRARRGQATDPHSIAERLRRERISERMKALQELVPSCNKTDRAAMLDEIVDYVKFLRLQVKVLSMSRLGGASAVAQLVADVPPSPVEGEGIEGGADQPWDKWSSDGTEQQVAKLMEEDVGAAMQFLQSKALCIMPISLASAIFRTHQPDGHSIVKPESNTPL